jgi:3'(2'), 5'-bisphosphate nucleotidase
MRQPDIAVLALKICALAAKAGDAIMAIYTSADPVQLANKADDSPLTRADLAAQDCIGEGLIGLTPGVPVVSEEDADSWRHRRTKGYFWLVDPLDGTKEFLARNGEFTVNIALVVDGSPVWGVVYAPALDQMY